MSPDDPLLDELARLRGIMESYFDIEGTQHFVRSGTQRRLLQAMGIDTSSHDALARALEAERSRGVGRLVPAVTVARADGGAAVRVSMAVDKSESWQDAARRLFVRLRGEQGEFVSLDPSKARPAAVPDAAPGRVAIELPLTEVKIGEWDVEASSTGLTPESATGILFLAPTQCYLPPAVERGERPFGFAAQLYSLPNLDSCGIGTIAAARELAASFGREFGAQLFGLSPLHATPNREPHDFSPYCPDSREWRNVVYLDLTECPEVRSSPRAQAELASPAVRQELDTLERSPRVHYQRSHEFKLRILALAFDDFRRNRAAASSPRDRAFAAFVERGGESLQGYCAFAARRGGEPEFHAFCQWLLEDQLASAQRSLRQQGLLGFYKDLAVGSSGGGADASSDPGLYIRGAEIGAPPDAFQKKGQTWGVSPMDPVKLRERAYAPFVRMLRAAMRNAGALRLDHVMGLWRLWWVPAGLPATEGAYVEYPAEDLLALVALESWRCQCLVIGEDLGTVPDGVRQRMERERILGCRVVLFERTQTGAFRQAQEYPPLSAASFASHDLPTFAGWWLGRDIELRTRLGLYRSAAEAEEAPAARAADRQALAEVFPKEPGGAGDPAATLPLDKSLDIALDVSLDVSLNGLHRFLGRTSSILALTSLEDALGIEEQRNVPGTLSEYPNWTGRLGFELEALKSNARIAASARALAAERAPHNATERRTGA